VAEIVDPLCALFEQELTAAGTVADFHGIPFYSVGGYCLFSEPLQRKDRQFRDNRKIIFYRFVSFYIGHSVYTNM
jgi:hypothetical protein